MVCFIIMANRDAIEGVILHFRAGAVIVDQVVEISDGEQLEPCFGVGFRVFVQDGPEFD